MQLYRPREVKAPGLETCRAVRDTGPRSSDVWTGRTVAEDRVEVASWPADEPPRLAVVVIPDLEIIQFLVVPGIAKLSLRASGS